MRVGILGLQGDFSLHEEKVQLLGQEAVIVKTGPEIESVDALIIPGGESTTLVRLADNDPSVWEALSSLHERGAAFMGTCTGMILLASRVENPVQRSLGYIDLVVERNGYGRQRESFESHAAIACLGEEETELVFIRAPRVLSWGPEVEPLGFLNGDCIMARQGKVLVASFHPELTPDLRLHRYFLEEVVCTQPC